MDAAVTRGGEISALDPATVQGTACLPGLKWQEKSKSGLYLQWVGTDGDYYSGDLLGRGDTGRWRL